jgi:hypothetical protein
MSGTQWRPAYENFTGGFLGFSGENGSTTSADTQMNLKGGRS